MNPNLNNPPRAVEVEIDGDDLDVIQAHLDRELEEDEVDLDQEATPLQDDNPADEEMAPPALEESSENGEGLTLDPPSDPAPRPVQAWCHSCEENIPRETPPIERADGSLECPKCRMNFVELMEADDEYLEEEEKEEKSEERVPDPLRDGLMGFLRQLGLREENIQNIRVQRGPPPAAARGPPQGPPPEVNRIFHQVGRIFGGMGGGGPPPFAVFQGPMGGGGGRGGGNGAQQPQGPLGALFNDLFRGFGQFNASFGGQRLNIADFGFGRGFNDILSRLQRQAGPAGPPPAAKEVVDSLKEVEITGDGDQKDAENYASCAVCKDEFKKGEKVIVFPCPNKHVYHTNCIKPWLKLHNSCPVCRHELKTDDDWYERMKEYRDKHSPRGSDASNSGGPSSGANG